VSGDLTLSSKWGCDIKCTLLNRKLDENFYMNNMDGYEAIGQDFVYKLNEFIHGFK
jgi:hypothetical protein